MFSFFSLLYFFFPLFFFLSQLTCKALCPVLFDRFTGQTPYRTTGVCQHFSFRNSRSGLLAWNSALVVGALARFHKTICHFSAVCCSPYILFSSFLCFLLFLMVLEYTCACNFLRGSVSKEQRFDVRDQCQADPPVLDFHGSKNHLVAGNENKGLSALTQTLTCRALGMRSSQYGRTDHGGLGPVCTDCTQCGPTSGQVCKGIL